MIITTDIARPIVDQIMKAIDYNITIMNHKGIVVASTNAKQIDKPHLGALKALELKSKSITEPINSELTDFTEIEVNVPIEVNNEIVGVVGITGNSDCIDKFIHMIKITVETLLEQQVMIEQLRFKRTALEEWVQNIIDTDYHNIPILESKAEYFNIDITISCCVFAIEIKDFNQAVFDFETLHQNEARIIKMLRMYFPYSFFATFLGKDRFIIGLPEKNKKDMERFVEVGREINRQLEQEGLTSYIGIGSASEGILGYRSSYLEALQSIDILKQVRSKDKVAHINEWGILRLLAQIPSDFRCLYLDQFSKRMPALSSELEETLVVYLENELNIKETAVILHIHRNTLIYRLDKIKELWGLDPRSFHDAVKLQVINLIKELK
ncbi:sugar diacid recognition domain-containing protein [Pseudogracilibacillus sp. SE30717A]|uniref:CdaR family transcriptional regulator n=1 Tax=Pseudogracilibacillus sp. SE30717A TaxID=3098293 RepID=UPI00300E3058